MNRLVEIISKRKNLVAIMRFGVVGAHFWLLTSMFLGFYFPDLYKSEFINFNQTFDTSLWSSGIILALTYTHNFCFYHRVSSWTLFASCVLNLIFVNTLNYDQYLVYMHTYAHFIIMPTTMIVSFFILKNTTQKRYGRS